MCMRMLGEGCRGSSGTPELGEDMEGGQHRSLCEGPAHFEGALLRVLLISNGAPLGNRRPFVGLQGSPWHWSSPSAEHLESSGPSRSQSH